MLSGEANPMVILEKADFGRFSFFMAMIFRSV
jgi:hypothetical protein